MHCPFKLELWKVVLITKLMRVNFNLLHSLTTHVLTIKQCHKLVTEAYSDIGGIELAKALLANNSDQPPLQYNGPGQSQNLTPWCVCRKCCVMDTAENKCCRQRHCITNSSVLDSLVLNQNTLNITIIHRSDFFVSTSDYTPEL